MRIYHPAKRSKPYKRRRVDSYKEDPGLRKWGDLDRDILVLIMKFLLQSVPDVMYCSKVLFICKSWGSALLDAIYPPGDVLDLNLFNSMPCQPKKSYLCYLNLRLKRPHSYTTLCFPCSYLGKGAYAYIAKRLPELKCFVGTRGGLNSFLEDMVPFWPKLEVLHSSTSYLYWCDHNSKFSCIRKLDLWGSIGDDIAPKIATCFPQLVHLEIRSCFLTKSALSIILDGQKNLMYLDTQHAFFMDDVYRAGRLEDKLVDWNEDEILQKVMGIKKYVYCARKSCSHCAPLYSRKCSIV